MDAIHPDQFLGLPPCAPDQSEVVIVPLPLEKTVSYGTGTWRAPRAILDASCQIEVFEEETQTDFTERPRIHTLPLVVAGGDVEDYLAAVRGVVAPHRGKFVLGIGGEHTVTFGLVTGLLERPAEATIVQIDAHADLIDRLDGRRWSHGTVMRRLWDEGCRLVQIGIRSLSREEYDLATSDERITTFFGHQLADRWPEVLAILASLRGQVYLTIDVDGLDPAVIPSTGTPQPGGLSWDQTMAVIRTLAAARDCRLIGADLVELVASPHAPGCDIIAAKLLVKLLAFWRQGLTSSHVKDGGLPSADAPPR